MNALILIFALSDTVCLAPDIANLNPSVVKSCDCTNCKCEKCNCKECKCVKCPGKPKGEPAPKPVVNTQQNNYNSGGFFMPRFGGFRCFGGR